jgi:K+-transporting ATPase KdpF subunit
MIPLYIIGGLVSLGLLIYLFVALLKPEMFS